MDRETREQAARWNLEQFFRAVELAEGADLLILNEHHGGHDLRHGARGTGPGVSGGQARWLEVVLTGRSPSERILGAADYVSEIQKVRHPYDRGILARKGIEY